MEDISLEVLVVDDEEPVRRYLATALRKNGFTVLEAPDGATAMKIIRERDMKIAAVVSDIVMPGIDGLKLAELNFQDGFRPFVVCTVISDAALALSFLKFGVRDYVAKPVDEAVLVNTVRNAIGRRRLPRLFTDEETPLPGNMGSIIIPARRAAIDRALGWLDTKASSITPIIPVDERQKLLVFASEFLMNAYEHGSLLLTEEKKAALLESGAYNDELRRLELKCKTKIEVAVSIVGDQIAISVSDAGYGFNYKRYQDMSESETLDRLAMPNGRGIHMAMHYFDSITFSKGGAGVMFTKKMAK
jgi:CheY-like chemotaxis protein